MTQEKAQEIIQQVFGTDAIAIGDSGNTIFWIYKTEDESNYKEYEP